MTALRRVVSGVLWLATLPICAQTATPVRLVAGDSASPNLRLSWVLEAPENVRGIRQTAYEVRVATSETRLATKPDLWSSAKQGSSEMHAIYAGRLLPAGARVFWQVRTWQTSLGRAGERASGWSAAASFTTPLAGWSATWIAATPDAAPGGIVGQANDVRLPLFRRSVRLRKRPVRAMLFVSGLGQYEFRINGRNVTQDVLTPGWTDYHKRVLYDSYDVSTMLTAGPNALAVMLGNGMYNALAVKGRYSKFSNSCGQPKLIAELHLEFVDGTQQVVGTDANWRTMAGPITLSNTYGGEDYDARLEQPGWDEPGYDDAAWAQALLVGPPTGALAPEQTPAVRVLEHYAPVAVTHPREGVAVYDLGQNFAGWPEIAVTGPAGARVRLLPGELLDEHGLVTQRSANAFAGDPADFHYTLRGAGGPESWHPRFSYYGFRYVQVESSAPGVQVASLVGAAIHQDAAQTGSFRSSNDLLNRIHTLILNAVRSNMMSILTDCPHREKLGWLEETHLFAASLMANFDVSALYRKMGDDMADSQDASGLVASIAPEVHKFLDGKGRSTDFRDSPEWGSAVVLSPWTAYEFYGDPEPLRAHYGSMQQYVEFLQAKTKDHMLDYGLGDWYDIGPRAPGYSQLTSRRLTATATLYEDLDAMGYIARVLGRRDDAAVYEQQAAKVREAFNASLFHADVGSYDKGSQTANAMPLALGMVPDAGRAAVLQALVRDIEAHQYHVTAGDVGFHYVVRALTDAGRSDVIAKMLAVTTSPSYGYQVEHGATTLTEAWDSNPNSSQNHFMLGHAEEWFYRGLAGIDFDLSRPVGEQIRIRPYIPEPGADATTHAEASEWTRAGRVACAWSLQGDTLTLDIVVPPNSTARVVLPARFSSWQESGRPLNASPGVDWQADGRQLEVASGSYSFRASRASDEAGLSGDHIILDRRKS
jgi:hypothetical protein